MQSTINCWFWMALYLVFVATSNTSATTVNYELNNVMLSSSQSMTGTFSWTFTSEFENGDGQWSALEIPWTSHTYEDLQTTFEPTSSIEITFPGNVHDEGLDITLFLLQPLTPSTAASIDLERSKYEIGGNGFHSGLFLSGSITPLVMLTGDFDGDHDVDGFDFLSWQRGEVSLPPSATDLSNWKLNYGTPNNSPFSVEAVPEPTSSIAMLIGVFAVIHSRWFQSW